MSDSIYTTLSGLITGGALALPAATFGPGPFQDAISGTCEGGVLRASGVTLTQAGDGATLTGIGGNSPFTGMQLQGTFVPDPSGAGMTLKATPIGAWGFASAWPLLAGSFAAQLAFTTPTLTLGTGTTGQAAKGLAFAGSLALGSLTPWSGISWLLPGPSIELAGPLTTTASVPVFHWTGPIQGPVKVPGLAEVHPALRLAGGAVANVAPAVPPYGPVLEMVLTAEIPLGPGIPVTIDISNPAGLIAVEADTDRITGEALTTLGDFLDLQLGDSMPKFSGFDPLTMVTLKRLGFMLDAAQAAVSWIWFELDTTAGTHWPLAEGIDIESIGLKVLVPFATGTAYAPPFVTVFGTVKLPGGSLEISGWNGNRFGMAAALTEGSKVKITELLKRFVGASLDAELYLDGLEMTAVPATGAWSMGAELVGDWGVRVGVVSIALTKGGVSLDHDSTCSPATTGTISATAVIAQDTTGQFTFSGLWTLAGSFVLAGAFPDVSLSALAQKLTGKGSPANAPEVHLTKAAAKLALDPASGNYDFSLAAAAQAGTSKLGEAALDIRSDTSGFGVLVGFELPPGWSPADLWSPLGTLFGSLTFERSGMVFSTLKDTAVTLANLKMPSVPATVGPGVAFFASLALEKDDLGYLGELLGKGTKLNLLGLIDTSKALDSTITASLKESTKNGTIQFKAAQLTLQPGAAKVTVVVDAMLTVGSGAWAEEVTIAGGGSLQLGSQPAMALSIGIEHWAKPFGIEHLILDDFGLRVSVIGEGLGLELGGEVTISQGPDAFSLALAVEVLDFEVPDSFVFDLQPLTGKTLLLSSLVGQFVPGLDLATVPVLGEIGFGKLELYVVGNPLGLKVGGRLYPQGIGLDCEVTLYSWRLVLLVEVNANRGVKAAGSVNEPIDLFDVLKLSDVSKTKGPAAAIDTGSSAGYLTLDGEVVLLAASCALAAKVTKSSFEFDFEFQFDGELGVTIDCALLDDEHFKGSATFTFEVEMTLDAWIWEGLELMPPVKIAGPPGSADLTVEIDPTVIFDLGFGLVFDWSSIHVNVAPHFTASELGHDLSQLWSTMVTWMGNNLEEVYSELKKDAKRWSQAIQKARAKIAESADDVTHVLRAFFGYGLDAAALILDELEFKFKDAVNALVHWFAVTAKEAARALGEKTSSCALEHANKLLPPLPPVQQLAAGKGRAPEERTEPDRSLFELTGSPRGQRLLRHFYVHREELGRLVRDDPEVRKRVGAIAAPADPDQDRRAVVGVGIEVLESARAAASPRLREAIEEVVPELERRRGMSWEELLEDLAR